MEEQKFCRTCKYYQRKVGYGEAPLPFCELRKINVQILGKCEKWEPEENQETTSGNMNSGDPPRLDE